MHCQGEGGKLGHFPKIEKTISFFFLLLPHIFRPIKTYHSHKRRKRGAKRRFSNSTFFYFSSLDASHVRAKLTFISRKKRKSKKKKFFPLVLTRAIRSMGIDWVWSLVGWEIDFLSSFSSPLGEHGNDLWRRRRRDVLARGERSCLECCGAEWVTGGGGGDLKPDMGRGGRLYLWSYLFPFKWRSVAPDCSSFRNNTKKQLSSPQKKFKDILFL